MSSHVLSNKPNYGKKTIAQPVKKEEAEDVLSRFDNDKISICFQHLAAMILSRLN